MNLERFVTILVCIIAVAITVGAVCIAGASVFGLMSLILHL